MTVRVYEDIPAVQGKTKSSANKRMHVLLGDGKGTSTSKGHAAVAAAAARSSAVGMGAMGGAAV